MTPSIPSLKSFVGGQFQEPQSDETFTVSNPATGEEIGQMPVAGPKDVDAAVAAARTAFSAWSRTVPAERASALLKLADVIDEHAEELTALEAIDAGKPRAAVAADEAPWWSDVLRFYAGAARCLGGGNSGEYVARHTSSLRREPIGVIGQITPWNYPLLQVLLKAGPAIATGNTVVLKPAENTPVTTVRLAELCLQHEVFPPGVFNVVLGTGRETGAPLIGHPDINMVSLTGSVETGRWVAHTAAQGLKPAVLELGGNAPVIVFDDSDVEAAVATIAAAGFYNAGQECGAATRILATPRIYDDVVARLADQAKSFTIGDTLDESTTLGPLISERQRTHVAELLESHGPQVEVVSGGSAPSRPGYFLEPTVLANLGQSDDLIQREIFGPVVTVQCVRDEEQALAWANDTRYGLCASVWTRDHGRALRVGNQLNFGTVWINTHLVLTNEMPHGGFNDSGYGKELGVHALEEYTRIKHVMASWD